MPSNRAPQRTCVACRQVKAQRELIRLVRTPGGNIEVDSSGKKTGRGAYLCRARECWEVGLKDKRLEYALRGSITVDNREKLARQASQLVEGNV